MPHFQGGASPKGKYFLRFRAPLIQKLAGVSFKLLEKFLSTTRGKEYFSFFL